MKKLLLAILGSVCLLVMFGETDKNRQQKAHHYFMAAAVADLEGAQDATYELYRKAHQTDPANPDAAYATGLKRLFLSNEDVQSEEGLDSTLALMRQFIDAYPEEYSEGYFYAHLAGAMDRMPEAVRVLEGLLERFPTKKNAYARLAESYMHLGEVDKAVATLERLEQVEGESVGTATRKISYLISAGDTVRPLEMANKYVADHPKDPDSYLILGTVYEYFGHAGEALAAYRDAERLDPEAGSPKLALANVLAEMGDSAAYDTKIYEALMLEDLQVEQKTDLLAQYLQRLMDESQNTQRGDSLFSVLHRQYPHDPKVLELAARYEGAKGDYGKAIENVDYAIDLDPANGDLYIMKMRNQALQGDYPGALLTRLQARNSSADDRELDLLAITVYSADKQTDKALALCDSLISNTVEGVTLDSDVKSNQALQTASYEDLMRLAYLFNLAGDFQHELGQHQESYRSYDNSLYLHPTNEMVLNNYAYFLSNESGDLQKALDMATRAVEKDPENPTYLDTRAWVLYRMGDYVDAREQQQKAIEKALEQGEKEMGELYLHMGDILWQTGEKAEALNYWQQGLASEPDNAELQQRVRDRQP